MWLSFFSLSLSSTLYSLFDRTHSRVYASVRSSRPLVILCCSALCWLYQSLACCFYIILNVHARQDVINDTPNLHTAEKFPPAVLFEKSGNLICGRFVSRTERGHHSRRAIIYMCKWIKIFSQRAACFWAPESERGNPSPTLNACASSLFFSARIRTHTFSNREKTYKGDIKRIWRTTAVQFSLLACSFI
jgi:hypothetical protein